MNVHFDFTDKRVFVFGGTSGINLGIAEAFADCGAAIAVASRNPDKVKAAVEKLRRGDREARGYSLDVRNYDQVAAALQQYRDEVGEIDILISGAAGNFPAPALGMSANGFKSVVDIDLIGTFNVMRAGFEHLNKPGASVINISAPQAVLPQALQVHVCAAKAGVDMVTRVLAVEWGPMGVRVNSVIPGPIDGTEGMARLAPSPEIRARVANSVPMRRMGTPADVAKVCLFLASDAAAYVSGTVVAADGGWLASGALSLV